MTFTDELDLLYDEDDTYPCRFVGFIGKKSQFDLVLIATDHFFGKTLVVCMQTQRSAVLSSQEAQDILHVAQAFHLTEEEAQEASAFLTANLP